MSVIQSDGPVNSGESGASRIEELRQAAAAYAAHGAPVVTVHYPLPNGTCSCARPSCWTGENSSAGKHPSHGAGWPDRTTTDPDTIQTLWATDPWNIGIHTSGESGLSAVDVDSDEGERILAELFRGEPIPATWEHRSGKAGGRHLLFRNPPGSRPRTLSLKGADGKEAVRLMCGRNSQILVPPSLHRSGRRYEHAPGRDPDSIPLAELPPALLRLMCPPPPPEPEHQAPPRGTAGEADEVTPWGDFNKRGSFHHTLIAAGFRFAYSTSEGVRYYTRPGKGGGVSVSLGYCQAGDGTPALWVWSGSIPYLDAARSYDLFGFVSRWKYGGDFGECASALRSGEYDGVPYGRANPVAVLGDLPGDAEALPEVADSSRSDPAPAPLSTAHLEYLAERGIPAGTATAAGLHTVTSPKAAAGILKWGSASKKLVPCLVIPYRDATGESLGYARVILDKPRKKAGKFIPVESPVGLAGSPYLTPHAARFLADPAAPMVVVVDELLALAADAAGMNCVGLPHPWAWRTDDGLSPVLAGAAWERRSVYLALAGDAGDKLAPGAEMALAKELIRLGAEVRVLRVPPGDGGEPQSLGQYMAAGRAVGELFDAAVQPEDADPRPEVFLTVEVHRTADEVRAAMASAPNLYRRGGVLVRETRGVLRPVPVDAMPEELSRLVRFVRRKEKADGTVEDKRVSPPPVACRAVHSSPTAPIREITTVIRHPAVLDDGRIVTHSGYDPDTGTLTVIPPGLTVSVPAHPTRADAVRAAEVLLDPFRDFNFVDDDDENRPADAPVKVRGQHARSAVAAAVLTLLARPLIKGATPVILVQKNAPGAGGTLLVNSIGRIVTGHDLPATNYQHDPVEMSKQITAWAVEAREVVSLDNVVGDFGNGPLCQAVTSTKHSGRLLGSTRTYDGPFTAVILGTGNNARLVSDMPRRVLSIGLMVEEERPESRDGFTYPDLPAHINAKRGELLSAALTILRAWHLAGRPQPEPALSAWGSYEAWSAVVRAALVFAGLPDPYRPTPDRDHVRTRLVRVLAAGIRHLDRDGRGLTAAQIVRKLTGQAEMPLGETLQDAADALAELSERTSPVSLGKILATEKNRNLGGLKIVTATTPDRNHMARWRVEEVMTKSKKRQGGGDGPTPEPSPASPAKAGTGKRASAGGAGDPSVGQSLPSKTKKRAFVNNPNRGTSLDTAGGSS